MAWSIMETTPAIDRAETLVQEKKESVYITAMAAKMDLLRRSYASPTVFQEVHCFHSLLASFSV
jgi:hypothetical protein